MIPNCYPNRGEKYWVLYNYIRGSESFHCNETVTLTTHGSYSFMDNLFPLLGRYLVLLRLKMIT